MITITAQTPINQGFFKVSSDLMESVFLFGGKS